VTQNPSFLWPDGQSLAYPLRELVPLDGGGCWVQYWTLLYVTRSNARVCRSRGLHSPAWL